ncbi:MAG: Asp-tRNA(Asn)/Glu-tRNA(Gln) amidotransferase subunit GatC, partial [Candidatus Eremiobacteraeota bacterium]|nr:Asp-tRNA(Asn)/Glu-tRNA(Gln) amidotransferase subunit GatC [Candidatus Eremiobacteraeota bacterium]
MAETESHTQDVDVRYVAKLARLALTDEEAQTYGAQLKDILGHVSALNELDTSDVGATAQVIESRNVWRDDIERPCLERSEVLEEAPQAQGGYF